MKKKIMIMILGAVVLCASPTWAMSSADTYKDAAELLTEKMQVKLELNEKQTSEVSKLNLEYIEKGAALRASNLGRMAKLALAREYHSEKKVELKKILSEEQFTEYELAVDRLKKIVKRRHQNW